MLLFKQCIWKTQKQRDRDRETFSIHWCTSQIPATAKDGPGQRQEPGTQSRSSTLEEFKTWAISCCLGCALTGSWNWNWKETATRILNPVTRVWDIDFPGGIWTAGQNGHAYTHVSKLLVMFESWQLLMKILPSIYLKNSQISWFSFHSFVFSQLLFTYRYFIKLNSLKRKFKKRTSSILCASWTDENPHSINLGHLQPYCLWWF